MFITFFSFAMFGMFRFIYLLLPPAVEQVLSTGGTNSRVLAKTLAEQLVPFMTSQRGPRASQMADALARSF